MPPPWPYKPARAPVPLDPSTVREVVRLLEERLTQVEAYGAGGCPSCHDAELRAAIARLRAFAD
jgi:hypothetical protein